MNVPTRNAGRLHHTLIDEAHQLTIRRSNAATASGGIADYLLVDLAHVIVLHEQGHLPSPTAAALAGEVLKHLDSDGCNLDLLDAPRGWYLAYERVLRRELGDSTGGGLHIARSRNDLGATVTAMRIRRAHLRLLAAAIRLQATLLRRARQWRDTPLTLRTNEQPAAIGTLGHWLLGVATGVDGCISALLSQVHALDECPLGACAVAGTSWPIDTERTARLLGFTAGVGSSVHAVASRDTTVRTVGEASVLSTICSRAAHDLLHWLNSDVGLLTIPHEVSGSSSMMPQKRNPFLLEHVTGRGSSAAGSFAAATAAMRGAGYTNAIAVHTEAMASCEQAIRDVIETSTLLSLVVERVRPTGHGQEHAEKHYLLASELANELVRRAGLSFRRAHRTVADAIERCEKSGGQLLEDRELDRLLGAEALAELSVPEVLGRHASGGGPSGTSQDQQFRRLATRALHGVTAARRRLTGLDEAECELVRDARRLAVAHTEESARRNK